MAATNLHGVDVLAPGTFVPRPYAFAEPSSAKRRMATALLLGSVGLFSISAFRQQVDVRQADEEYAMSAPSEEFKRMAAMDARDAVSPVLASANTPAGLPSRPLPPTVAAIDH
jgi:hypothetical protein